MADDMVVDIILVMTSSSDPSPLEVSSALLDSSSNMHNVCEHSLCLIDRNSLDINTRHIFEAH